MAELLDSGILLYGEDIRGEMTYPKCAMTLSVTFKGIVEDDTVLKNWYTANGFTHTGTKRFGHLPFTVGFMEWRTTDNG
jgi:hypothetical protein